MERVPFLLLQKTGCWVAGYNSAPCTAVQPGFVPLAELMQTALAAGRRTVLGGKGAGITTPGGEQTCS